VLLIRKIKLSKIRNVYQYEPFLIMKKTYDFLGIIMLKKIFIGLLC